MQTIPKDRVQRHARSFVRAVWKYYEKEGRHTLPWRLSVHGKKREVNPYHILVSEVMLQQTQVERVIPKYHVFLKCFPTPEGLAEASLGDVLRVWQGLGYNRRARMLHECARVLVQRYRGVFPHTHKELMSLPGIGAYTAGALMAFAFNEGVPIIETNIRTAILHHFFKDEVAIDDKAILEIVDGTLDRKNPRAWYYALMDYGAYIKREFGNQNIRSKHYTKQSTFKGSDRQIRGAILTALTEKRMTRKMLHAKLPFEIDRIDAQLERLREEGMIACKRQRYTLPV